MQDEVIDALHELFRGDLRGLLGSTLWQRLEAWAARGAQALQQLIVAGTVDVLPRRGGDPLQYFLAGMTRLALS
ncbi:MULTISPECIES: hypothetical protein [unclassified Synechococcus]|uniref:hypothetical protein n=1 Tax=unclassified Synechococcus TaxID=2626047 RepID=UPI0021A7A3CE|nr:MULTISPECIES: hypothetical protein [unclassified Synechococcus]MCT0212360.1 hypothetical protein [Synechococcus sp. CS-1326]MCT0234227.1 hypothetical protein [Synechococcus sp. CS-1327]